MRLTIIGGGRAAWAYGSSWQRAGWVVDRVLLRPGSANTLPALLFVDRNAPGEIGTAELVLVAVSDDALPEVCRATASQSPAETWLFHPSGAHDSGIFGDRERVFSLHPLRALPPPGEGNGLVGALLVFEGADAAEPVARAIASRLGARLATVTAKQKPIYHAAAVIAANLVAAQLDVAAELLKEADIELPHVRDELAGLARSALDNWTTREGALRFTGPIARGDVALVRKHLDCLGPHDDAKLIYRTAGLALCRRLLATRPFDRSLIEIEKLLSGSTVP